jgi:hypothetical protein
MSGLAKGGTMMMCKRTTMVVATAALIGGIGLASSALASNPANKVMASGAIDEVMGPGEDVTILSGRMKTAKPTDVIFSVSLECAILTDLVTNNENGGSATSQGAVKIWVEVDGNIVPIISSSEPPQNPPPPGGEDDKVTFCNRAYSRTVTDDEDPADGIDEEADSISTRNANAFNWVRLNMGSGTHEIEVHATLTETATNGTAEAIIGNRTLVAEPTMMANDAEILPAGSH